jgi:tetratricopeptide (TPR) repeat protein
MSAGSFFLEVAGQHQLAFGMYEFTLVCAVALAGHDSPDVAASYNNTGNVYNRQGQYERALEYYQKALEINIKVSGQDHPGRGQLILST